MSITVRVSKKFLRATGWTVAGLSAALMLGDLAATQESFPPDLFAKTPAFSGGDQPAKSWAGCDAIRAMADALPATELRVDLSVTGKLTSIRTDGALWYLTLCSLPGLRVMCVAYNDNGMKVGDTVFAKGGYTRVDRDHVLLDPCLASNTLDGQ